MAAKSKAKSKAKPKNKDSFFSRRRIWAILAVSVVLSVIIISRMVVSINEGLLSEITIYETDISEKPDGVYNGIYSTSGYSASVDVTIAEGLIVNISTISQTKLNPTRTALISNKIIKHQRLNFDELGWISELPDRVFLKAVERALQGSAASAM